MLDGPVDMKRPVLLSGERGETQERHYNDQSSPLLPKPVNKNVLLQVVYFFI